MGIETTFVHPMIDTRRS